MSLALVLSIPFLAAGALALTFGVALLGRRKVDRASRTVLRWILRKAESAEVVRDAGEVEVPRLRDFRTLAGQAISTSRGIWASVASAAFLLFWIGGWVPPRFALEFLWHFLGAWASGLFLATAALGIFHSAAAAGRLVRLGLFAEQTGLRRIWLACGGGRSPAFAGTLQEALAGSDRIEVLDFSGHELIAKGSSEEGGPLASVLARMPDKDVRVLLFNPCTREIDPDRKHTTVLESQLAALEMSREAFDSRLQATLARIDVLNKGRERPIEVRLYSEKPSFRAIIGGETAFLGSIDGRDTVGALPLVEVRRHSEASSLHTAIRGHFLRAWGDSLPVEINATTTVNVPVDENARTPVPKTVTLQD